MCRIPKDDKRIVSKSQYVQTQVKSIGIGLAGVGLLLLSFLCTLATFVGLLWLIRSFISDPIDSRLLGIGFLLLLTGSMTFFLGKRGFASIHHAETIDPGIPFSRKSADTLPAEDSLVRASEEPIHPQQAILLRAATDNRETPPEELVRPVGGQEP